MSIKLKAIKPRGTPRADEPNWNLQFQPCSSVIFELAINNGVHSSLAVALATAELSTNTSTWWIEYTSKNILGDATEEAINSRRIACDVRGAIKNRSW